MSGEAKQPPEVSALFWVLVSQGSPLPGRCHSAWAQCGGEQRAPAVQRLQEDCWCSMAWL